MIQLGEEFGDDIKQSHIDGGFAPGPYVQSMIYEITRLLELRVMSWIMSLGFSQQLYDDDEFASLGLYQKDISHAYTDCMRALPTPATNNDQLQTIAKVHLQHRFMWAAMTHYLISACAQVS